MFWAEHEWHGRLNVEVRESSPLRLQDPAALRELVKPRISPMRLVALFFTTLLARLLRADTRKKLRRLLGLSYV
jgi:hypothetical protein